MPYHKDSDILMLWAAATVCFFGFFRVGEITWPTITCFDVMKHLAWGDMAIDCTENLQALKIHLKKSKMDQLEKGVDVCMLGKLYVPYAL